MSDGEPLKSRHIPYVADPNSRYHHYEQLWKVKGLELLCDQLGTPRGETVLDYGCGRGETLQLFSGAGFTVAGADLDPECVRLSRRFGPADVITSSEPTDQFAPKSFDIVTCFHVLEHVDSPKQTLTALAKIARQYVVLAVPNLRALHRIFARDVRLDDSVNEGHLQSWDHWHLLSLAERYAGLKLVKWGFDATILSGISGLTDRVLGPRAAIALETGLFRRLFPYHGISVLGLFRPV